jgi:GR25 family glycosyltransferase involved in LPS biosynthesis
MLDNIFYINLEQRTDRKKNVEQQLNNIGWTNYTRFNAIKCKDGRVGCSMSHLKILKNAKEKNLDYVVIIEDDIVFTDPNLFNTMLKYFLEKNIGYDVLLLAGNIRAHTIPIDSFIHRTKRSCTTTGYIVKKHYYDTLINNIENGIKNLIQNPNKHMFYAIDTNWFKLQEEDNWLIFRPRTVSQLPDYSDIEKKHVSYNHLMLDKCL